MDGQIGQQRCQPSFAADQLDRLVAFQRRLNQPIGNHFRHGVGNTDTEGNTLLRRIVAQRLVLVVGDVDAADKAGVAVDHHDFSVIAVVLMCGQSRPDR